MIALLCVKKEEAQQKIDNQILEGKLLFDGEPTNEDELKNLNDDYKNWHEYTVIVLTSIFNNDDEATLFATTKGQSSPLHPGFHNMNHKDFYSTLRSLHGKIKAGLDRLSVLLRAISENNIKEADTASTLIKKTLQTAHNNKVFIVHGHDESLRHEVENFLLKNSLMPVILHEQTNQGKTIIEKFEANADVAFAIVLLTPDDEGRKKLHDSENQDSLKPRARQNVILELGYFMAKLGRANVCALVKGSVETPSDYSGVVFETYDQPGAWKIKLIDEMRDAGVKMRTAEMA